MRSRSRSRFRLATLIAAAGLIPLGLGGTAAAARSPAHVVKTERSVLTAAQVLQLAAHATDRSIIIFKNQLSNLPARGPPRGCGSARPTPPRRRCSLSLPSCTRRMCRASTSSTRSRRRSRRPRSSGSGRTRRSWRSCLTPSGAWSRSPTGEARYCRPGSAMAITARPATLRSRSARAARPSR